MATEAIGVERGTHGVGMQAQFRRNGADFPMLGMKQVADLSDLFIGNHASPRGKDLPSVPGVRRPDTRPSRPVPQGGMRPVRGPGWALEWPRGAHEPEALSDSHREKQEGKIDLSRELSIAGGTRVGAGDGRGAPRGRDFVDSGGWPRGAGDGGIFGGNGGCSNAGRGHSGGRDKTPRRKKESDTHTGERLWNKQLAPVSRGSTGQPAPIMAGWLSLLKLEVL